MNAISHYDVYNKEMTKPLYDKMFFVDKVDTDLLVDFGCADAALICNMARLFPDIGYIGYDFDPEMIRHAKGNWGNRIHRGWTNAIFTSGWSDVEDLLSSCAPGVKTTLVLSSLIHEIYSYCSEIEIKEFWDRVFNSGFDNIVIRDMTWIGWPTTSMTQSYMAEMVRAKANQKMLEDFENIWGPIEVSKNLMHFLLKYRYEANWNRELNENYLPLHANDLLSVIPEGYKVTYKEFFSVPFIAKQVQNDFDIEFDAPTHVKLILEKVK